jgi:hypothetical protein
MLNLIQHCSRAPGLIWIDRDPEPPDRDNTEDVEEHQTQKSPQVIRLGGSRFLPYLGVRGTGRRLRSWNLW